MAGDNAAFRPQPQGFARAIWPHAPSRPYPPQNAFTMALSWPWRQPAARTFHAIVRHIAFRLHGLVVRPAAALWRNPIDVAVGVLHVAGFAVNAVLGVDLEARGSALLHPFIDARRAIAVRRTCEDVVLGRLLQVHVQNLQMDRLILFVV